MPFDIFDDFQTVRRRKGHHADPSNNYNNVGTFEYFIRVRERVCYFAYLKSHACVTYQPLE